MEGEGCRYSVIVFVWLLFVVKVEAKCLLLDDNRYGPGNRPHWANKIRFPNLIKALNQEPDMDTHRRVSSLYQALT